MVVFDLYTYAILYRSMVMNILQNRTQAYAIRLRILAREVVFIVATILNKILYDICADISIQSHIICHC